MTAAEFFVPGPLPGNNEIIDACKRKVRRGSGLFPAYMVMKQQWMVVVIAAARRAKLNTYGDSKVSFAFHWLEPDRRRDPDNVSSGGRKIVLDGLVKGGYLKNDGWKNVRGWSDSWDVSAKNPGVRVWVWIHDSIEA